MSAIKASDLPDHVRRKLGIETKRRNPTPAIRLPRDRRSKLEREFEAWLRAKWPDNRIKYEPIKVQIGPGIWYTPDYMILEVPTFYEVKGYRRRGDRERMILAAQALREVLGARLYYATKVDGVWNLQRISSSEETAASPG
jgi:hypothetical protein